MMTHSVIWELHYHLWTCIPCVLNQSNRLHPWPSPWLVQTPINKIWSTNSIVLMYALHKLPYRPIKVIPHYTSNDDTLPKFCLADLVFVMVRKTYNCTSLCLWIKCLINLVPCNNALFSGHSAHMSKDQLRSSDFDFIYFKIIYNPRSYTYVFNFRRILKELKHYVRFASYPGIPIWRKGQWETLVTQYTVVCMC